MIKTRFDAWWFLGIAACFVLSTSFLLSTSFAQGLEDQEDAGNGTGLTSPPPALLVPGPLPGPSMGPEPVFQAEVAAEIPEDVMRQVPNVALRERILRNAINLNPLRVEHLLQPYPGAALRRSLDEHPEWWCYEWTQDSQTYRRILLSLPTYGRDREASEERDAHKRRIHRDDRRFRSVAKRREATFEVLWERFECSTADVNSSVGDLRGRTPLHHAALFLHPELIRRMLTAGADPLRQDNDKKTPLMLIGASQESEEVLIPAEVEGGLPTTNTTVCADQLLSVLMDAQEEKTYLEMRDDKGRDALSWATLEGHVHFIRYLLEKGAPPNGLGSAAEHPESVPVLQAFLGFRSRTQEERDALSHPLGSDLPSSAELERRSHFLEHHEMEKKNLEKILNLLLEYGLDARSLNCRSDTASVLWYALDAHLDIEFFQEFLRKGADPSHTVEENGVYLYPENDAARMGRNDIATLLFQHRIQKMVGERKNWVDGLQQRVQAAMVEYRQAEGYAKEAEEEARRRRDTPDHDASQAADKRAHELREALGRWSEKIKELQDTLRIAEELTDSGAAAGALLAKKG